MVSVERDNTRAEAARDLFANCANVFVVTGDWRSILSHGPFDLLVLDGGGSGKTPDDEPVTPSALLKRGGTIVIDDFSPRTSWPPAFCGEVDQARMHWLEQLELLATEIQVAPDMVTIVATLR